MAPTFFSQLAAGILVVLGLSDLKSSGWKYLRLMALVSLAMAFLAAILLATREAIPGPDPLRWIALAALGAGLAGTAGWLTVITMQGESIRPSQRAWPLAAGVACMVAAGTTGLRPDVTLPGDRAAAWARANQDGTNESLGSVAFAEPTPTETRMMVLSLILGAMVLGGVTAGMLLGHRYLTDTDMPIAPLRRLTQIYLIALEVRALWCITIACVMWAKVIGPSGGSMWFWVVATVRGGVGLLGAGVFAYMIHDCVKSRATQSATAIFYLSMIFVFLGELAAQYLMRTQGLAV